MDRREQDEERRSAKRFFFQYPIKKVYFVKHAHVSKTGCFTKTPFLEIHITLCRFLVLAPIETNVRKCVLPENVFFLSN